MPDCYWYCFVGLEKIRGGLSKFYGEDDGEMIGDGFVDIMREDECDG